MGLSISSSIVINHGGGYGRYRMPGPVQLGPWLASSSIGLDKDGTIKPMIRMNVAERYLRCISGKVPRSQQMKEGCYGPSNRVLHSDAVPAKSDDASAITTRESDRVSPTGEEISVAEHTGSEGWANTALFFKWVRRSAIRNTSASRGARNAGRNAGRTAVLD